MATKKDEVYDPFSDEGTVPEKSPADENVTPPAADSPSVVAMAEAVDDPAQARIRQLELQLAAAEARAIVPEEVEPVRPKPESELTPEEKRIRELEDRLARTEASRYEKSSDSYYSEPVDRNKGDILLLHFVEDGFTANGRVWYRGQELEFQVGSKAYEDTKDRNGRSWLDGLGNDRLQYQLYGKVYFRSGSWPGQGWEDPNASEEERKRSRRAPAIPNIR